MTPGKQETTKPRFWLFQDVELSPDRNSITSTFEMGKNTFSEAVHEFQ